jgi:hypothetical protein
VRVLAGMARVEKRVIWTDIEALHLWRTDQPGEVHRPHRVVYREPPPATLCFLGRILEDQQLQSAEREPGNGNVGSERYNNPTRAPRGNRSASAAASAAIRASLSRRTSVAEPPVEKNVRSGSASGSKNCCGGEGT